MVATWPLRIMFSGSEIGKHLVSKWKELACFAFDDANHPGPQDAGLDVGALSCPVSKVQE